MTRIFFIFFILIHQSLFGQKLSKKSLVNDLTYLNEAVINGHPQNYNPDKQVNIQTVIDEVNKIKTDSISTWEYTLWIEKGLYHIGCIHTSIQKNPLPFNQQKLYFIPLTASIQNDKLLITSCTDSSKVGQIIEKINGSNVSEIIDAYKEYKASDGITNAFSREYFHFASSKLISVFLGKTNQYKVQTANGIFDLKGTTLIYQRKLENEKISNIIANEKNSLYLLDNFAVLKVSSFEKSDKHFFKTVFSKLNEIKYENLILDLRQNTGGNRKSAIELTKYLADAPFSYSILQPKLATKKYLNAKGKRYLFLSKLKYNLGNIFKSRKTELGREFEYQYKPKSENNFNGKIFVLTDGFTASSSTLVTSWLKQFTNATFIGNRASGGYNGNNGGSFPWITLPASKIEVKFPAYRLIFDKKSKQNSGIIPDILIDTNTNMEEIIKQINKK